MKPFGRVAPSPMDISPFFDYFSAIRKNGG
jgi:hypothetical protein